jgi:hypothetical protein
MARSAFQLKHRFLSALANARSTMSSTFYPTRSAKHTGSENKQECCVGYFGLNRSLNKTGRSIASNIHEALAQSGFRVSSAAHFNCPSTINSPRSGEFNVAARHFDAQRLGCELVWLEPQEEAKIEQLISLVMNVPMMGEHDSEGIVRKNALFQMYSQSKLLQLLKIIGMHRFKVFCLARADLLYLDPLPAAAVSSIAAGQTDIVTPSWQRWGGFNDRFALCSRAGAEVYLDRINWVSRFCDAKGYFHPEELLQFSIEQSGLTYGFMPMRAKRVRSTGAVRNEDFIKSEE